jgi:phosphoribosylformylglycinamidine (FGAM) synthase-like amidotransferase family enzyme
MADITHLTGNIFILGMMPHPERATAPALKAIDGGGLLASLLA